MKKTTLCNNGLQTMEYMHERERNVGADGSPTCDVTNVQGMTINLTQGTVVWINTWF